MSGLFDGNSHSLSYLKSATRYPIRYSTEISPNWRNSHPGFYILLRNQDPKLHQPWIKQPDQYFFSQDEALKRVGERSITNNGLILLHHNVQARWDEMIARFPDKNLYWTFYNMTVVPNWPIEKFISFGEILSNYRLDFDFFYDCSFWKHDTLSPIHLHLLHNFKKWENLNFESTFGGKFTEEMDSYYGKYYFK